MANLFELVCASLKENFNKNVFFLENIENEPLSNIPYLSSWSFALQIPI